MQMRNRILLSILVAVLASGLRYALAPDSPNDLLWPLCHAREWLSGHDPYGPPCQLPNVETGKLWPPNPMTTAWLVAPFSFLYPPIAAVIITGLCFGLASFALLSTGTPWRLVVLLSWPAFYCLYYAQLPPLLLAVSLMPSLMPLGLAKPQLLLPAFVVHFTWRRALACMAFLSITLLFDLTWPLRFLAQTNGYDGYVPMLTLAGPALLLLGLRWREPDARFLLLCGLIPQRLYHDLLLMSAILKTRQEALLWTTATWLLTLVLSPATALVVSAPATYLIAVCLVLFRPKTDQLEQTSRSKETTLQAP